MNSIEVVRTLSIRTSTKVLQLSARRASAKRSDSCAFGRSEHAGVDPADHDEEQQYHRPDVPDRLEPHRPGAALARGAGQRIAPGHPRDGEAEEPRRHDARQNAGREELADIGLGHDAVDHHDHRRRDQDAERSACGD